MLTEVTHLQEILESLCMQAGDPYVLPASSEQVIQDLQGTDGSRWTFKVCAEKHEFFISMKKNPPRKRFE